MSDVTSASVVDRFPTGHLPAPRLRTLPEPPASTWRIVGPGVIAAGVGLASGEFILYPYIASQVGLVFVWAALVGLATQFFRVLPEPIRITGGRVAALVWTVLLFGTLAVLTIIDQVSLLFGD